jgi:hypothetical protein
MTDTKRKINGSKSLAVEAKRWLQSGVRPIPIRPRSKRPAGGDGWNQVRLKVDDIDRVFKPGVNLGALWGKPSGWVIDLDLDWEESVRVARSVLPRTYLYGTEERPGSHYLFVCPDSKTHKWIDPTSKECIVELRSTGSQSLLPGSTHPDGFGYEIDADRPIAKMSATKLLRLGGWIAGTALCARHYPSKGGRHDFVHAFTGTLLHSGASPKTAELLGGALLDAVSAKESDRGNRERTIRNTIERHKDGTTHGWRTLADYLPGDVVTRLKTWFSFSGEPGGDTVTVVHTRRAGSPVDGGRKDEGREKTPKSIPRPSLVLPGLVGDIAKWASKRSMVKQPLFDLAVGLWCTALATGNRYKIGNDLHTPLQPYFMLLAPTSGGKDNVADAAFEFARKTGLRDNVFAGFQSYHVLADKVAGSPSMAGWIWDEAARHLKSSSKPGSQDYQVLTWLMKLYGKASSSTPGLPARNESSSIPSIDFPFFLTLATAQPGPFIEAISSQTSAFDTGLMNRFVLFDAGDTFEGFNDQRVMLFPSSLTRAVERFRELPLPLEDRPQRLITMESSAFLRFREFRDRCAKRAAGGEAIDTLWGRANQNALILAGTVAVGIDHRKPRITKDIADWAIGFVAWSVQRWADRLEGSVATNFIEARSKKIEGMIRDAKRLQTKAYRPSWKTLLAQGCMPKSFLIQKSRNLRGPELDETLKSLEQAGLITSGETENGAEWYRWSGG